MQKKFIRYFAIIMVITVGLTLCGNFLLQTRFAQEKARTEAASVMEEINRRIEENEKVIETLVQNLNENYITRADAFAELIVEKPDIIESFDEMERIARLLRVDEVHVTDENGILRWGNVKAYYGLDFSATDQTRPFLPALTDKNFKLAQEPQLNGSEGKLFQYISVARQDQTGIVQVGVAPEILDRALVNNRIDVVVGGYNVSEGMDVIVYDRKSGLVVADARKQWIGKRADELGVSEVFMNLEETSGWVMQNGEKLYAVFGSSDDHIFEVTTTRGRMFTERQNQTVTAAISSILLGLAIIAAIYQLLKRWIINDIEHVNHDLNMITEGSLDVVVGVKSSEEFVMLSDSINEMVSSLKYQMNQIAAQAKTLEEQNVDILASLSYARKIQNNLLPSPTAFQDAFEEYDILWEPRDVVGGDIYWLKKMNHGSVLCVCDCTGHGTPGALLTMIVVTALDAIVREEICDDPAQMMWELEQRLVSTLNVTEYAAGAIVHDGADLAILYICEDGEITLSSAKLHVFVCNGETVDNIRGQKLSIGDGSLTSKEQIKTLKIPASDQNVYYIVSDGLFEQVGGTEKIPYGYKRFKQMILEEHGKPLTAVTDSVWQEFLSYMGDEGRRDDVTLLSFKQKKV